MAGKNVAQFAQHHARIGKGRKDALCGEPHFFGKGEPQLGAESLIVADHKNVAVFFSYV